MTRPWVKLDAQTHRKLDSVLSTDAQRVAYYAALEEGKLAESEGEWADDAEFTVAVGRRHAKHLAALIAAGLLERSGEGWVRIVGWEGMTNSDPTNAERQRRWRQRQRALRNASRNDRNDTVPVTDSPERETERRARPLAAQERASGARRQPEAAAALLERTFAERMRENGIDPALVNPNPPGRAAGTKPPISEGAAEP